jgi:hypothetical protein
MPEIIACPDCGRKLRVPDDLLGRKVKCPGCGVNFTASVVGGGAPPPIPQSVAAAPRSAGRRDDRYDDRPRRRDDEDQYEDDRGDSVRSPRQAWKKVRFGLTFVIISIWVYLGAVGIHIIGLLFLGGLAWDSVSSFNATGLAVAGTGIVVLGLFVQVANLAHLGLKVTGFGFGMAVPPKRNSAARGLGIASFIVGASQAGLMLVIVIILLISTPEALAAGFSFIAWTGVPTLGPLFLLESLTWIAASIVFLFYLRSLCLIMRKDGLASTIVTYMISVGGVGLVMFLLFLFTFGIAAVGVGSGRVSHSSGGALAFIGCGLMIIGFAACLALFAWYIVILHQVKYAVHSYIRKL